MSNVDLGRPVTCDDLYACVRSILDGDEWSPEYAAIVLEAYRAVCAAFPGRRKSA